MYRFIQNAAKAVGFDACGILPAKELTTDKEFLKFWLKAGNQAGMSYLERNVEKRTDPALLVEGCKTVIVVLLNYFPEKEWPATKHKIARYAFPETDYHDVMKRMLLLLEREITNQYGKECVSEKNQHVFVDSAPVLERALAREAGLGWIGRHTQLISPLYGSYCFIGELFLNVEVQSSDVPLPDRCGNCTRCIDACPTHALEIHKGLNARKCISYQTIENKNPVDHEFRKQLSGYMAGCDICAEVCPWNMKLATFHSHAGLSVAAGFDERNDNFWEKLDRRTYLRLFAKSALSRIKFEKLKENISFSSTTTDE